ncbi:type I pullulanase [Agathobacter rectalis]|uniref:Pullulanase n=1 Tax=Agathobacter rectalis TaxID=39491 RepID=A0A173RKC9_9FIRM|nr:type I pullulanase [Agathobacter rectalis]CUM78321.1 Pullulanase precursor [Agathobacter rectalis]
MKLGAIYSKEKTTFTLFSPVADSVFVIFYDKGNDSTETGRLEMMRGEGELRSIFSATAEGNLDGVYYTYEVHTADGTFSSHDPYARACGVNGHRSMVIDLSKTDPDGFADEVRPKLADPMSMVITEVSVVDVSAGVSAHSRYPGKFKAFTEDKTLSYFKDMGVTHLQLMPSYDFASIDESDSLKEQYNWGYDPYNYNVPEGSYSTDPFNGAVRVREYKEMVHSIHEAGLGVIMDVVYNHTFNVHDSCFYKTAGNYFYRMLDAAKYSDASACGNEIASEKPIVRKYIIDSLCYWASEYHIDGFRFDLMGVLDIETLNEARKALLKINPDIIMYGEGWTGGESTLPELERGMKINAPRTPGIGMFSDDIRDAVKGHVFYMDELGFVNGAADRGEELKQAVTCAKWAKSPMQSINYLSCHDNYTLWDRFIISNSHESEEMRIRMNKLAAAILFTAQGIPFFLHGEEFARTKISEADGAPVENSYCSPLSVNAIDYDRAEQFSDLKAYYKGLIALRRAHKSFYLDTVDEIKKSVHFMDDMPDGVVAYTIDSDTEKVFVAYNAGKNKITIKLADALWEVLADESSAGDKALYTIKDQAIIPGVSCLVAVSKC